MNNIPTPDPNAGPPTDPRQGQIPSGDAFPAAQPPQHSAQAPNPYAQNQPPHSQPSPNQLPPHHVPPHQVAPNAYAGKPKRGLPRGAIIGIVAGAVVVLLGIITVVGVGVSNAIRGPLATASSAVEGYLSALQSGDAKKALSYLEKPDDNTFLTDDVLKASNKLAKISKVSTTSKPFGAPFTKVKAKYSVGSERVTQEFVVEEQSDGTFTIFQGGTESVSAYSLDNVPLTLNGQDVTEADDNTWILFPGAYTLGLDLDAFTVDGGDEIIIAGGATGALDDVKVTLNDTGIQQFRDAVTEAVNACVASTALAAGCGIDIPSTLSDGTIVQDGTISRTLSASAQAALASLEPQETYVDPLVIYGDYIGAVNVTSTNCTINGQNAGCTITGGPSIGSPQVDFTSGTPVVRWD